MSSMPFLPPEVLSLIFSYVGSKATLSQISKCSRAFHHEALPYLYRSLDLRLRRSDEGWQHRNDRFQIQRFTMLFLGNLKLAMLVRRLSIRPSFGPGIYESESDTGNRVQHLAPAEVRALI